MPLFCNFFCFSFSLYYKCPTYFIFMSLCSKVWDFVMRNRGSRVKTFTVLEKLPKLIDHWNFAQKLVLSLECRIRWKFLWRHQNRSSWWIRSQLYFQSKEIFLPLTSIQRLVLCTYGNSCWEIAVEKWNFTLEYSKTSDCNNFEDIFYKITVQGLISVHRTYLILDKSDSILGPFLAHDSNKESFLYFY